MFKALEALAAIHSAKFLEDATPATSRQIGFLVAIARNNNIEIEEFLVAVENYNGGHAWGLDKECASALISSYATAKDLQQRKEKVGR